MNNKIRKNSRLIDIIVLISIFVLFPLFSSFKYNTVSSMIDEGYSYDFAESVNDVDYDAFSFVCRAIKYVDFNGFTHGRQILNTIFFFVPRSIIPIKGENTGALIVNSQVPNGFDNVSCPIISELFIDFSYFGVIFGPIIISFLFEKMDRYKDFLLKNENNNYFKVIYSLVFGYLIYILRGALAPTFLRLMGSLFVVFIFYLLNLLLAKFDLRFKKTDNDLNLFERSK